MFRIFTLLTILLLTLSGCGKDKTPQVQQSEPVKAASMSHAIANQPVVAEAEAQPALENTNQTDQVTEAAVTEDKQPAETTTATAAYDATNEPTTSIVSVQLENKFGPVLVPHSLHVKLYYCIACHQNGTPGKINKTKKEFHTMCRGCHAKIKAGPTKCRSCHQRR